MDSPVTKIFTITGKIQSHQTMHCKPIQGVKTPPVEFLHPGRVFNPTLFILSAPENRNFIGLISEFVTRFCISIILRKTMKRDRYVVFEHSSRFIFYFLNLIEYNSGKKSQYLYGEIGNY
jgi:hypothetical protein